MKAESMKFSFLLIHCNSLVMEQRDCLFIVAVTFEWWSKVLVFTIMELCCDLLVH
jgi:hypothetical protein